MQTLLDEAQVLSKCLCKYLHQVLSTEPGAYGSEREKKREKRPEKGKRDAKRRLTEGGGGTASPQAAITQQVISRCVCLACGAFSKKSVRIRPQSGPWQGGRRGEWADLPRVYSKSTEGWLPTLVGGMVWPLVGMGRPETTRCLPPCLTVRDDAARARASAEGIQAMPAQPLSLDGPTVGGSKTRRQECLPQEGGAPSNPRNA